MDKGMASEGKVRMETISRDPYIDRSTREGKMGELPGCMPRPNLEADP